MRPRLLWRVALPVLSATSLAKLLFAEDRSVLVPMILAAIGAAVGSVAAWRQRIVVRVLDLFERGLLGWRPPLLLDHLRRVDLHWDVRSVDRKLLLVDGDDVSCQVSLRWFAGSRRLVGLVLACLLDQDGSLRSDVAIDPASQRRLRELAVPSPETRRRQGLDSAR